MAGIPRQFPNLAVHLTDQTRQPIITSSALENDDDDGDVNGQGSAPSRLDNSVSPTGPSAARLPRPSRQQRAQALDDITATALRARDAAARLGLGANLPSTDTNHLDGPEASAASLMAALGMTPPEHFVVTYDTGAVVIQSFLDPCTKSNGHAGRDGSSDDAHDGPMLVNVVVAPDDQSLGDARRASARLDRVGRQVQHELANQRRR